MAAITPKSSLKEIFSGLSSICIKKSGISAFTGNIDFDWDMPVTVDSLSFSQAEPTLNRTKVHGLQADWCVTAESGEITFKCTVPFVDDDITDYFLNGGTAGTSVSAITTNATPQGTTFSGKSYELKSVKLYMGIGLISDDGEHMILVKKLAVYATPLFENASSTPFGFTLTGSIEASDTSSDNIAFLKKTA